VTRSEIDEVLKATLPAADPPYDLPDPEDWRRLEAKFATKFPESFVNFIELLAKYEFPGDVYNVCSRGRTNGNDSIEVAFDVESGSPGWPRSLVPFYGIGNGDYFALDSGAGPDSPVLYWYHERSVAEVYAPSFDEWLRGLPAFLG
jgi:hypothetical protein